MPIDSVKVGSNERIIQVLGDPITASNEANVLTPADATSLSGKYALVTEDVNLLLNASGTFDQQRSALGTTGITAVNTEGTKATYSAGTNGFTPVATATDFFAVIGSGTKTVRVTRISVSGTATSASSVDILLIKRSTANTGSTPADLTPFPHDSNDGGVTATVRTYTTTNPTTGSSVGTGRAKRLNLGAAGAAGEVVWDFTTRNEQGIVLRGVAQYLCLNWAGAAVPSGTSLCIDVTFTEE